MNYVPMDIWIIYLLCTDKITETDGGKANETEVESVENNQRIHKEQQLLVLPWFEERYFHILKENPDSHSEPIF
ncbi:hypothetical protein V1477_010461 [Vespula maculifrons]|uniref:Uncharacterized protein n=1 Tax=Vespula maculifrons TaxID=7453 RepID=A0ABD2C996_VESMC